MRTEIAVVKEKDAGRSILILAIDGFCLGF
jgi:hypothetical protein